MKIKKIFVLLVMLTQMAALAQQDCLEITETQMSEWMSLKPELPSFGDLLKAKQLIDKERKYSLKLGNDKTAHCYLGCRLSETINFETAQFTGWQKEYNDATDCNKSSKFDVKDYQATVIGAEKPIQNKSFGKCADFCKKKFKK